MTNKPIAGAHLGQALIDLLERLNGYRSNEEVNLRDVLRYMKDMGYLDFRKCSDHALAILQFSEHFQMADLWADAFAHCIGMMEILRDSTEFEVITLSEVPKAPMLTCPKLVSRASKLFIHRAFRELRLRLEQAADDLGTFFQDRLSGTYLGLSDAARDHLDRFRSFLNTFYLGKYGRWPPPEFGGGGVLHFPKEAYRTLYFDFRCLYEYLADMESTPSMQHNKLASGGLCVLQNVSAFDRRNGYQTLLHPLPLLPENTTPNNRADSGWATSLRPFGQTRHVLRTESVSRRNKLATVRALVLARNNRLDLMSTAIIQEYSRFEKVCTLGSAEKVSAADGRKVRWLLIYTVLQTLVSVNEAPREVTQKEDVPYPLCCHIPNLRPWNVQGDGLRLKRPNMPRAEIDENGISPDAKYPYYLNTRRSESSTNLGPREACSAPGAGGLRRLLTKRSHCKSRMNPRAKASVERKNPAFCEIIVYGYGNGLNQTISDVKPLLQRHETRRNRPQVERSYEPRLIINNHTRKSPVSCPSTASSEYSNSPGLSDDSSGRNSTTTMATVTTATTAEEISNRPISRITIKHNSYTSLISSPYSNSSDCSSVRRRIEGDGTGKRSVNQAIRCPS
ncbi:hypothetical protein FQN54_003357 [Arachnomyces sp. PD_36]|nr:hypothetical protein FQN54_003357 [Arachnomyces sp. PD_36]